MIKVGDILLYENNGYFKVEELCSNCDNNCFRVSIIIAPPDSIGTSCYCGRKGMKFSYELCNTKNLGNNPLIEV